MNNITDSYLWMFNLDALHLYALNLYHTYTSHYRVTHTHHTDTSHYRITHIPINELSFGIPLIETIIKYTYNITDFNKLIVF